MRRRYDRQGYPIMTPRERELEALLHRLRRLVFNEHNGDKAERLAHKVKARLQPYWEARHAVTVRREGDRFMRLWE